MNRLNTVQALKVSGATLGQLNYWVKLGLGKPNLTKPGAGGERSYELLELVVLQTVRLLSDSSRLDRLRQIAGLLRKLGPQGEKVRRDTLVIVHADGTTSTLRNKALVTKLRHDSVATVVYPYKLWGDAVGYSE